MHKSKISTVLIIFLILAYILASQFYLTSLGNIYTFIINPLFFICIAIFLKLFILPPYSTNKFKQNITQYVLITILAYSLVYLLSGLLVTFGKSPYSTSIRGILLNLYSTGSIIFCREYIRYKLINNVYNNYKNLVFTLLVIVFSLLEINISSLFSNLNFYYLFKLFFYTIIPTILKNIAFTYITQYTDHIPSFLYEIIYYLILWISPILPNSPWVLDAILNSLFPLILLLYCKYYINKKNRFHLNSITEQISPSKLLPFGICLVLLIWFALGIFPVKPVGVATGSMYPELKVGDLVIIEKCTSNDVNVGDIIQYKMDGYTVIHRVKEIHKKNNNIFFITKGDNNSSKDKLPVSQDQLMGKVIFKIRYLALPTVWLHNINTQTQVEIEKGV